MSETLSIHKKRGVWTFKEVHAGVALTVQVTQARRGSGAEAVIVVGNDPDNAHVEEYRDKTRKRTLFNAVKIARTVAASAPPVERPVEFKAATS
jgi:TPP-dependent indolepyruvate ferredoxin oxidoreductase alpha subunit